MFCVLVLWLFLHSTLEASLEVLWAWFAREKLDARTSAVLTKAIVASFSFLPKVSFLKTDVAWEWGGHLQKVINVFWYPHIGLPSTDYLCSVCVSVCVLHAQ